MQNIGQIAGYCLKYKTGSSLPAITANGTAYLNLATSVYSDSNVTTSPFTFVAPVSGIFQVNIYLRCYVDTMPSGKFRARLFSQILNGDNSVAETEQLSEWISQSDSYEWWKADAQATGAGSFSDFEQLTGATIVKLPAGQKFKPYLDIEGLSGLGTNEVRYKGFAALGSIGTF